MNKFYTAPDTSNHHLWAITAVKGVKKELAKAIMNSSGILIWKTDKQDLQKDNAVFKAITFMCPNDEETREMIENTLIGIDHVIDWQLNR